MIIAIDPGPKESAYVVTADDLKPIQFAKSPNDAILFLVRDMHYHYEDVWAAVVEKVSSYGMKVGADVFETVYWSGRFAEAAIQCKVKVERIPRMDVKMHICHDSRAKDGNIMQALIDRFGNKGTKAKPGWFYGFCGDVWQAYALAVTFYETHLAELKEEEKS